MSKVTLKAEEMTSVHFKILQAIKDCSEGNGDKQSLLTAASPTVLLSRILPEEMKSAKGEYAKAMCELNAGHWVENNSQGRVNGLAHYWLSSKAVEVVLAQSVPA